MRILLVDDDDVILEFLQACLESGLPGADVTQYASARLGRPGPEFRWADFDVLLLDYNLGRGETGIDWLEAFAGQPAFPRTLLLTSEDSAKIVGNAVRNGADGYLNKFNLTPDSLVSAVQGLIDTPADPPQIEGTATSGTGTSDTGASGTGTSGTDTSSGGGTSGAGTLDTGTSISVKFRGGESFDTGSDGASYRFVRLIGRGGMSRVYLAERTEDRTTVVLKILDRDVAKDPENVERFAREGEVISKVDSPYVVKIHGHGFTNSYGYIAMEFFGRGDLAQRITQGVSPEDAVLYLHNIACGLDAIHRLGIVHRDLKPGNVMFRGDGSMALVDFGLSKRVGLDASLTQTGVVMGTPYCMSPEQTSGLPADERSDLYGAGVMFYEMLTGARPFNGPNMPALLLAIQTEPVPRLPPPLARYQPVVDRLLAKSPDDRYQNAGALIEALEAYLEPA